MEENKLRGGSDELLGTNEAQWLLVCGWVLPGPTSLLPVHLLVVTAVNQRGAGVKVLD